MKRHVLAAAAGALCVIGGSASAGVYSDDLAKCLVRSTSDSDKSALIQWMFAAMSADPTVKDMATVSPQQRSMLSRRFAEILQRLMFVDCRQQAVEALKYEGTSVIEQSFSILGQVAMRGLMSGPSFKSVGAEIDAHLDRDKWNAMFKEAGVDTVSRAPAAAKK
jgi:hypothetical protein